MPKLILVAVALLLDRPQPACDDALHSAMHARIRSRKDTQRLRAPRAHEARLDLRALDLTGPR